MKQLLAIAVLVICSPSWEQQNLVPNGSFEEYYYCPQGNELFNGNFTACKDWWYPIVGTPDYFNSCNNFGNGGNDIVGVPQNFWGYQFAYAGEGYVGMVLVDYNPHTNSTQIEPIQCKLTEPLKPCTEYVFSAYVSLANESFISVPELSIILTQDSVSHDQFEEWLEEDISWTNETPITDTTEWIKISGNFVSTGFEKFLTIGYFQEFDSTNMYHNDSIEFGQWSTYYLYLYLDSLSINEKGQVENCKNFSIPNVFTPNGDNSNDFINFTAFDKVTICNRWGTTVLVMASQSNFLWYGKNFREEDLPAGVYYYVAEKAGIQQTGSIHLIR